MKHTLLLIALLSTFICNGQTHFQLRSDTLDWDVLPPGFEFVRSFEAINGVTLGYRDSSLKDLAVICNEYAGEPKKAYVVNVAMGSIEYRFTTGLVSYYNQWSTQAENPKGLHQRYFIQKIVQKTEAEMIRESEISRTHISKISEFKLVHPDLDSEYFIMRLDEGGSSLDHIKACRIGVHAYADAIENKIPQLAKDLRERYPLL
jgi:hypothetical protein